MNDLIVIGALLGVPCAIATAWWVYLEADAIRNPDASAQYRLEQAEMQRQVNANLNLLLNEVARSNDRIATRPLPKQS